MLSVFYNANLLASLERARDKRKQEDSVILDGNNSVEKWPLPKSATYQLIFFVLECMPN